MRISDWSSDVCSSDLSDAGLVLLTAAARREDRVLALSLGVDHYLVKPDDHHELEMVIRNLHRRLRGAARDLERSEEHTSELQSLMRISYAVFCLKKKTQITLKLTHLCLYSPLLLSSIHTCLTHVSPLNYY